MAVSTVGCVVILDMIVDTFRADGLCKSSNDDPIIAMYVDVLVDQFLSKAKVSSLKYSLTKKEL